MVAPAKEFENVEVKKPWGFEYLMYGNDQVALWYLHLNAGAATSLHCHPRKKTGLVLLSGKAEVSFSNAKSLMRIFFGFSPASRAAPVGSILSCTTCRRYVSACCRGVCFFPL